MTSAQWWKRRRFCLNELLHYKVHTKYCVLLSPRVAASHCGRAGTWDLCQLVTIKGPSALPQRLEPAVPLTTCKGRGRCLAPSGPQQLGFSPCPRNALLCRFVLFCCSAKPKYLVVLTPMSRDGCRQDYQPSRTIILVASCSEHRLTQVIPMIVGSRARVNDGQQHPTHRPHGLQLPFFVFPSCLPSHCPGMRAQSTNQNPAMSDTQICLISIAYHPSARCRF